MKCPVTGLQFFDTFCHTRGCQGDAVTRTKAASAGNAPACARERGSPAVCDTAPGTWPQRSCPAALKEAA